MPSIHVNVHVHIHVHTCTCSPCIKKGWTMQTKVGCAAKINAGGQLGKGERKYGEGGGEGKGN
jgi:hypothetical protein